MFRQGKTDIEELWCMTQLNGCYFFHSPIGINVF